MIIFYYIEDYPFIIRFKTLKAVSHLFLHLNIEDYPFIIRFKTKNQNMEVGKVIKY